MSASHPFRAAPHSLSRPGRNPIRKAVAARARIDPETADTAILGLDGRSAHHRFLKRHKTELLVHVGGSPSPTQNALIESAAMLALRLHLMDLRFLAAGGQTKHDSDQYLAWANTYRRTLVALGTKGAPAKPKDLRQHIAARAGMPAP